MNPFGSVNISKADPLHFHSTHSTSIQISLDGCTAKLATSYSYFEHISTISEGAAFSDRPIRVNEKICLRIVDIVQGRNTGVLIPFISLGFTSHNPRDLGPSVPIILIPTKNNYWMKWLKNLREINCEKDKVLFYYVNEKGTVHYGINGEEFGVIISEVPTDRPLWAAIALFGGLREVQLVDSKTLNGVSSPDNSQVGDKVRNPNNSQNQMRNAVTSTSNSQVNHHQGVDRIRASKDSQVKDKIKGLNYSQTGNELGHDCSLGCRYHSQVNKGVIYPDHNQVGEVFRCHSNSQGSNEARRSSNNQVEDDQLVGTSVDESLPMTSARQKLTPVRFHKSKGKNIKFVGKGIAAKRDPFSRQAYVFTAQPIRRGQTVVVQILEMREDARPGSVIIGLTSTNPDTLTPDLEKQPEVYYMTYFDSMNGIQVGDEVGVTLTSDGKMEIRKNSSDPVKTVQMDEARQLWGFVDSCGKIQKIKLLITMDEKLKKNVTVKGKGKRTDAASTSYQNIPSNLQNFGPKHGKGHSAVSGTYKVNCGEVSRAQAADREISPSTCNQNAGPIPSTSNRNAGQIPSTSNRNAGPIPSTSNRNARAIPSTSNLTVGTIPLTSSRNTGPTRLKSNQNAGIIPSTSNQNLGPIPSTSNRNAGVMPSASNQKAELIRSTSKQILSECTICLERNIDSVIYKCGHMCLCYDCAVKQWKRAGTCPLCRGVIKDVIRTFIP